MAGNPPTGRHLLDVIKSEQQAAQQANTHRSGVVSESAQSAAHQDWQHVAPPASSASAPAPLAEPQPTCSFCKVKQGEQIVAQGITKLPFEEVARQEPEPDMQPAEAKPATSRAPAPSSAHPDPPRANAADQQAGPTQRASMQQQQAPKTAQQPQQRLPQQMMQQMAQPAMKQQPAQQPAAAPHLPSPVGPSVPPPEAINQLRTRAAPTPAAAPAGEGSSASASEPLLPRESAFAGLGRRSSSSSFGPAHSAWNRRDVRSLVRRMREEVSGLAADGIEGFITDWILILLLNALVVALALLPAPRAGAVYITAQALSECYSYPRAPTFLPEQGALLHWLAPLVALAVPMTVFAAAAPLWVHWRGARWWRLVVTFLVCVLTAGALCGTMQVLAPKPRPDFASICWPDGNVQWLDEAGNKGSVSAGFALHRHSIAQPSTQPHASSNSHVLYSGLAQAGTSTVTGSLSGSNDSGSAADTATSSSNSLRSSSGGGSSSIFAGGRPKCSCSAEEERLALRSFPSAATTWLAAAYTFLALWLALAFRAASPLAPCVAPVTREVEAAFFPIETESDYVAIPVAIPPAGEEEASSRVARVASRPSPAAARAAEAEAKAPSAWRLLLALLPLLAVMLLGVAQVGAHDAHAEDVAVGLVLGGALGVLFWRQVACVNKPP